MGRKLMMLGALVGMAATMAPADAEARPRVSVNIQVPVVAPAPAPAKVWVPAQTVWDARLRRHVVVPGHWQVQPRSSAVWVPGHWERRGRAKVWVSGRWAY